MAGAQLETFLRRLRRVLGPQGAEGASDAQLLARFVHHRDDEAFELLVWRHGLMVLNVCRRVSRHEHDAEDAFQATFLALARKAGTIGKRESVGSWLYKVAYRVALRVKNTIPMQSLTAEPLPEPLSREPVNQLLDRELSAAIDEEIQRLPEKYRVALVLCHLEGQTIESAARSLHCPPGTVGTWLARARTLLRRRLARRDFDVSDVSATRNIIAALSAVLVSSTVRAAVRGTAEQAAASGIISASVAALTKGALQTMFLTRCTATAAIVVTLSLLGGGAFVAHRVLAVEPAPASSETEDQSTPSTKCRPTAVSFQLKFEKGQPFYQILTTRTTQQMKVMSNDVPQAQKQTFYFQWTPLEEKDGKWTLKQKILGVKMDIDIGGNPIKYDSTRAAGADASNPLGDFFDTLVGTESKLILDVKTHTVLRNDLRKDFINKLGAANRHLQPLLDKILDEDAVNRMAEDAFGPLMGPARPGDSRIARRQLDMGPLGKYQNRLRYTYEGSENNLERILVKITTQYLSPGEQQGVGGLPFTIRKSNLRGSGTGFLYFDRAKGRLASSVLSATLGGTLEVEIGGQQTQVDVVQTQQTTVQTIDVNPLEAAPLQKGSKPLREETERLRKDNEQLQKDNERLRRRLQAVEEALHRNTQAK
jgi:RNA polymerase sigma factor (sigma-70 family)